MDTTGKLDIIQRVKDVKSQYFRFMDGKDWSNLSNIFCEDAIFDARQGFSTDTDKESESWKICQHWIWRGRNEIVESIKTHLQFAVSIHHGHCHEITVNSENEAEGVIAMQDRIFEKRGSDLILTLDGSGHYHETYARVGGSWRIKTSRLTRLYVRHTPL